ncbi:MAG: hypothetical protein FVQ81_00950 [Candidatus Glassbacteria bacterium]|nr:hypothetical protein [Candidatus Glassbacteria bacterium]
MDKQIQFLLENCPGISRIITEKGHLTVLEYATGFFDYRARPIQPIDDFIEVVCKYSEGLLGRKNAELLEKCFGEKSVVLTANHHGVSYKSITLQGEIIFSLPGIFSGGKKTLPILPVLACGIVPLSNCTFPRGIVLSREIEATVSPGEKKLLNLKFPLIPGSKSQCLVSLAPPVGREQLNKAKNSVERHFGQGDLLACEKKVLLELFSEEYDSAEVLGQVDYSDQAVILNRRIWKRIFSPEVREDIPDIAYLEMERVVVSLLHRDLSNRESLIYNILFEPSLQERVIGNLDGETGCWNQRKLVDLWSSIDRHPTLSEAFRGCGTNFFCFADTRGRRIPALLDRGRGKPLLRGIAPGGKISIPFTPEAIRNGLKKRLLLPGLFLSFATLAFARGIKCIGGFLQVDYLPAMQRGLIRSFVDLKQSDWVEKIAAVPTVNFLTGMNIAMSRYPNGDVRPSGAVELIASGGLTAQDLDRIKDISVFDANLSGLLEFYAEMVLGGKNIVPCLASITNGEKQKVRSRLLEKEL